jgi:hypothetical protein
MTCLLCYNTAYLVIKGGRGQQGGPNSCTCSRPVASLMLHSQSNGQNRLHSVKKREPVSRSVPIPIPCVLTPITALLPCVQPSVQASLLGETPELLLPHPGLTNLCGYGPRNINRASQGQKSYSYPAHQITGMPTSQASEAQRTTSTTGSVNYVASGHKQYRENGKRALTKS